MVEKMIREIKLTQSFITIIDDEDFERANQFNWHVVKDGNRFYALRNIGRRPDRTVLSLHRFILNAPKEQYIDHINGNGLDNRKSNLRFCSNAQNCRNQKRNKKGHLSKFKGVSLDKRSNSWVAYISYGQGIKWLGTFTSEVLAALAYNNAALKYHGEFARLNEIKEIL